MLDINYDSYAEQQLIAEANSFENGYAKTGKNLETAMELYYKAYNKFGNLRARNRYYDLKSKLRDKEETTTLQGEIQEVSYYENSTSTFDNNILKLNISTEDLPSVIGEQVNGLKELKRNVDDVIRDAESAKNSAETAAYWKHNSYLFGLIETKDTKGTIENVQKALQDLAKAQQSAAQAQKVSYQNQEKIGQITRYLFALGVSNIAANRSVVNRLKKELEGASASELSEMARQEIIAVIRQLKAQEDLLNRQNNQGEAIRQHDDHLYKLDNDIKKLSEKQSNSLTKKEHSNDLKEYDSKLEGLKNLISDAEKGLLDKIGKSQTIENAKQEKQEFINATEEQKKALAEEVQNRNEQIKNLTEQQKQAIQGVATRLSETAEEQRKALAEEVQNRNDRLKQLTEDQEQTIQELEQRNNKNLIDTVKRYNEELGKIDTKHHDAISSLTNRVEEYKRICYEQKHEIEDLKNKLNDLNALTDSKVGKKIGIGIALLAIVALCIAVMPYIH